MRVLRDADGRFEIRLPQDVIDTMLALCVQARRLETGGILMGRYTDGQRVASISRATGPGDDARAGPAWLVRGIRGLQRLLDAAWSSGSAYYLGEWHFHPFSDPAPSRQDHRQMTSIATSAKYNCPEPILLIVGGDPNGSWTLHVQIHTHKGDVVVLS